MSFDDELSRVLPEIALIEDEQLRCKAVYAWQIALEAAGIAPSAMNEMPFSLLAKGCGISLAQHIRAVTRSALSLADAMASSYGGRVKIDRDLVAVGGLLHDVGKVLEHQRTDEGYVKGYYGKMLRHPFSGVWVCERAGLPVEVLHIVAVHSKEGDGGYRSIEANIIFHCDFANFEPFKD
ncbi:MAG TPA: HD domain-containing protein [bacterium]|nr:HD domain-containing protein [bacterium]